MKLLVEIAFLAVMITCSCSAKKKNNNSEEEQEAATNSSGTDELVNTAPTFSSDLSDTIPTIFELTPFQLAFSASDPEQSASAIVYTVTTAPVGGFVSLASEPIGQGGTFTQEDVDNNLIFYNHPNPYSVTANTDYMMSFEVTDGVADPFAFDITIRVQPFCSDKSSATDPEVYGQGTVDSPFIICTAAQFISMAGNSLLWDKHFSLKDNIDISSVPNWTPIGNVTTPFTGSILGNNFTIDGLTMTSSAGNRNGLFGYVVTSDLFARDLKLSNVNISVAGRQFNGALAGWADGGRIHNVQVSGVQVDGSQYTAGLIGVALGVYGSEIGVTIDSNANDWSGGISGIYYGNLRNFYYRGSTVTGLDGAGRKGGVASEIGGNIQNGYIAGNLTSSDNRAGGVSALGSRHLQINNIFVSSDVQGDNGSDFVGRFIGVESGLLTSGFDNLIYASTLTCNNSGLGNCNDSDFGSGSEEVSADVVANPNYFYQSSNAPLSNFDFENVWKENASDYPSIDVSRFYDPYFRCSDNLSGSPFAGGSGRLDDPYLICTKEQLNNVSDNLIYMNAHFKLMADIDLSSYNTSTFNRIGSSTHEFSGIFNGNGYEISNLTYGQSGTTDRPALFEKTLGAHIYNLKLDNFDISGFWYCGTLIGDNEDSSIIQVTVTNSVVNCTGEQIGGLVGSFNGWTPVFYVAVHADVTGGDYVGGFAGYQPHGTLGISHSYFNGTVSGSLKVGGIIGRTGGHVQPANEFDNVFVSAIVNGDDDDVSDYVGRLIGHVQASIDYSAVYYDNLKACTNIGAGNCNTTGAVGAAGSDFEVKSNLPLSKWDFTSTWEEVAGQFPRIRHLRRID